MSNALLSAETAWWLFFFTALGLTLGSFLNSVIYRLPRNRSLRRPLWSFCPHCHYRILWYDNIPIVSFVLLRGRCRRCGVPISTRYVVVEAIMALVVLMLLDAFFIGRVRSGLFVSRFGLFDSLVSDWPILAAHIILFACLLPMSVIDLEHYWVDVRFTNFAVLCGFLLHTIWTPPHSDAWTRPSDAVAVASVFALAALVIVWIVIICHPSTASEDDPDSVGEDAKTVLPEVPVVRRPPPSLASPSRAAGWIAGAMLAATIASLFLDATGHADLRHTGRALLPLLYLFFLVVWESTMVRASDQQIIDAIHEEKHGARRMVLVELAYLLPSIAAGALGLCILYTDSTAAAGLREALHFRVTATNLAILPGWSPVSGFATAASGFIIAGAIGWVVRIGFTLMFGKEAFGVGDIHLMAAAGCVAGWPVVVLGFFLTCGLALAGWLLALPFKRTRAMPLGPWLSLSFLVVVIFYDPIVHTPLVERVLVLTSVLFQR